MRRFILFVAMIAVGFAASGAQSARAADFSSASVSGPFACVSAGSANVKGAMTPASAVTQITIDGKGSFSSGKQIRSTGCSYTVGSGSSYTVDSDGTGTSTVNWTAAGTNPAQCPPSAPGHNSFVIQNATTIYGGSNDNDALWFVCSKQGP